MKTFVAPQINPSLLPAPDAIEEVDFESIRSDRITDFVQRAASEGLDYDVGGLETDPVVIVEEVDSYRETLVRARINDGIRAVLPAFAKGADLDHVALKSGVVRQPGWSDKTLLQAYLANFARPSAGSEDAYIIHCVEAWPDAYDVAVRHAGRGQVAITLLAKPGERVPEGAFDAIRERLRGRYAVPLTDRDMITIGEASLPVWTAAVTLVVPPGPAPSGIVAAAEKQFADLAAITYAIGMGVPLDAIYAAARVPNVLSVRLDEPFVEIPRSVNAAPVFGGVRIRTEVAR
ncbi:Phage-related baseplate assembly protein [Fulvimarina manganoxydans]|uniref:Phage-related baseplate assembly protein n=1 Tax=Fulvimarina manganoxydans TaxID=937218 RepID=A0A1W1Z473_9HYPH|nr:baseplate J/gp47 family protein [Fulvimarina manganoxydans]SMC43102.1 Phage-related baseplate assembly protein [Fulvimarina manganoxydans]